MVIKESALLFESRSFKKFDKIIYVYITKKIESEKSYKKRFKN